MAFHGVVSLVMDFFPRVQPDSFSPSTETSVPWETICAYSLCDFPVYHKALRLHVSFSACCEFLHVALLVDDVLDFETYVRGLVEAQFFFLWSVATLFEFLRDSECVPQDSVISQLSSSVFRALAAQVWTTYSPLLVLQQLR